LASQAKEGKKGGLIKPFKLAGAKLKPELIDHPLKFTLLTNAT